MEALHVALRQATWRPGDLLGDLATWRPGDLAVARVASGCQGVSMGAGDLHQFAGDLLATYWRPTGDQLATYWRPTGDLLATFHWRPGEPGLRNLSGRYVTLNPTYTGSNGYDGNKCSKPVL